MGSQRVRHALAIEHNQQQLDGPGHSPVWETPDGSEVLNLGWSPVWVSRNHRPDCVFRGTRFSGWRPLVSISASESPEGHTIENL